MPCDRSPAAASGSSSHLTLTPPYDSRSYTGASMTGSLYVARSELKSRHKRTSNCMTQSMMITPKSIKTTKISETSGIFLFYLHCFYFSQAYILNTFNLLKFWS